MANSVSAKILTKRLGEIQENPISNFRNVQLKDDNLYHWEGLLVIDVPPFKGHGIKVEMIFPQNFPFNPPVVVLTTPLHHMSVTENGEVCLPILLPQTWKPAVSVASIIQSLYQVLTNFKPESPVRPEIAEQFNANPEEFYKALQDQLSEHGVPVTEENGSDCVEKLSK